MVVRYLADGAPGLTSGEEYVVLEIMVSPRARDTLMFMVHLPEQSITDWAWYEAHLFEVIDAALPPNWVYSPSEDGFFLKPAAWTRSGHYDDLFADDRARVERAWSDHRAERDLVLKHAGRPPGRPGSIGRICKPPRTPASD